MKEWEIRIRLAHILFDHWGVVSADRERNEK